MSSVAFITALLFCQTLVYLMLLLSMQTQALRLRLCPSASAARRGPLLFGSSVDRPKAGSAGRLDRGNTASTVGNHLASHTTSHGSSINSGVRTRFLSFSTAVISSSAILCRVGAAGATGSSTALSSFKTSVVPEFTSNQVRNMAVEKRPLDKREYRALQLDNDLRVLLISDSSGSNRAAAALDVHVGAFSDPG